MACNDCGLEKELVANKSVCWKCHLQGVNFNARIEARRNVKNQSAPSTKSARGTQTIEI